MGDKYVPVWTLHVAHLREFFLSEKMAPHLYPIKQEAIRSCVLREPSIVMLCSVVSKSSDCCFTDNPLLWLKVSG